MKYFDKKIFLYSLAVFFIPVAIYLLNSVIDFGDINKAGDFMEEEAVKFSQDSFNPREGLPNLLSKEVSERIKNIPRPDLKADYVIPDRYPEFYRKDLEGKIQSTKSALESSPFSFDAWNRMAILRKSVDDFKGAAAIWEYLLKIGPENAVYLGSLGELHQYFLKDYGKSESYYLRAVKSDPDKITVYRNLYDLYKFLYKQDTDAALKILLNGVLHNPQNIELLRLTGQYYKEKNDYKDAKIYYSRALGQAIKEGKNDIVNSIRNEISSFD